MNKAGGASATRGTPLEPSPRPARTHQGTAGAPDLSRAQRIFQRSASFTKAPRGRSLRWVTLGMREPADASQAPRLMRACVRMGCGGPCSAPLPDLKTLHQSRSLRNAATTATGRLRAGSRFSPLTPGGKAGGWARKSAARQYVGKNRSRRFPQASSAARFSVRRTLLNKSRRDGFRGLREKARFTNSFCFRCSRRGLAAGSRWFVGGSVLPGAGHSGAVSLHFLESRSARVGRHVLRGGFASGTSRRRELGAHGAG